MQLKKHQNKILIKNNQKKLGTGIAPFRSFWQERKIDKEMTQTPSGINGVGWGKMWLYFGCRQLNVDDLYKSEIEEMLAENVISTLYIAQSREPNKTKVIKMII